MLEKEGITRFISGYKFDLNGHGFGKIMDDKYATYEVLKRKKIPVIEHHILYSEKNKNDYAKDCNRYETAYELFEHYNQNIVLKGNIRTCGLEVFHITTKEELTNHLDKLFQKQSSISLCPFYEIKKEYRLIMLENECLLMYAK